jgi:hypothetical protein
MAANTMTASRPGAKCNALAYNNELASIVMACTPMQKEQRERCSSPEWIYTAAVPAAVTDLSR